MDSMYAQDLSNRLMALRCETTADPTQGPGAASELSTMIDSLLNDLTSKFTAVANELTAKMDDMSRRIDNLEQSLTEQETQEAKSDAGASVEGTSSGT